MVKKAKPPKNKKEPKNPPHRPEIVLTSEQIEKVHELAQCDGTYAEIAAMLGIAKSTFEAIMGRQEEAKTAYMTWAGQKSAWR